MDFTFTDEQEGLRDAVRRLGAESASFEGRAPLWRVVTEQLGLTGIGIAESDGGVGGDFVDAAVVIEEAGRALLPAPLTTTLVAGAALARSDDAGARFAPLVASGECVAVVAVAEDVEVDSGRALRAAVPHVLDGDVADAVVLAGPDALWWVDLRGGAASVAVQPLTAVDPSRGQARIVLSGAPAVLVGDAAAANGAVDLLRVALSLEAVGAARRCLELTVAHLKSREQFGRPIGSFQALQHRTADLVVGLEAAASTAYYAAWAAAHAPDELPVVAPAAKALCGEAAWQVAAETIQMHGGIGFTWEHPAHRYFKRITTIRLLLGDAASQRRLVAERAALT